MTQTRLLEEVGFVTALVLMLTAHLMRALILTTWKLTH
jgi:hypothetical protein